MALYALMNFAHYAKWFLAVSRIKQNYRQLHPSLKLPTMFANQFHARWIYFDIKSLKKNQTFCGQCFKMHFNEQDFSNSVEDCSEVFITQYVSICWDNHLAVNKQQANTLTPG